MYNLPESALDPRPGDVVIARSEDGWQVMVIEDLVAVDRLLPLGDRGSRRYVPESLQHDSAPTRWQDQVLLLVSLYSDRFASAADAAAAEGSDALESPVRHVLVEATTLTTHTAVVHRSAAQDR
jgi:hypothetical protein